MIEYKVEYEIGHPPAVLKQAALQRAFEALTANERRMAVDDVLAGVSRGERSLDGLLAAWRGNDLAAAIWSECQAGHAAGIWPPQLAPQAPERLSDELLARSLTQLEAERVTLVQCLLLTDASADAQRLRRAGFEHSCDLLYLVSTKGNFPPAPVTSDLTFAPVAPTQLDDLAKLVETTYEGTLDCPVMDRIGGRRRDCRDVLDGYRATCRGDLSYWFLVRFVDADIGCLLLARDDREQSWELVYMGLIPSARGRGWGIDMVRQAQWLIARRGAERLVLAVDAANEPALKIYAAAGFVAWDRRSAFLKFLSPRAESLPTL